MNGMICNSYYMIDNLIKPSLEGILGVECATSYHGLSTFRPDMPILLWEDQSQDNDGEFVRCGLSFLFVPNVNKENIVKLSDTLYVTDKEQTIVDMLRYNRHEFHLYESILSAYWDKMVDIERLERIAKEYNVYNKLMESIPLAEEAYYEDNGGR